MIYILQGSFIHIICLDAKKFPIQESKSQTGEEACTKSHNPYVAQTRCPGFQAQVQGLLYNKMLPIHLTSQEDDYLDILWGIWGFTFLLDYDFFSLHVIFLPFLRPQASSEQ